MEVILLQVIIVVLVVIASLFFATLTVLTIVGVRMVEELARAKQALVDLNAIIEGIPTGVDHTADVKEIADGIVAAGEALKAKLPQA